MKKRKLRMCNDFLPDSVNAFLDDVETTTCLPILVIIVICTIQFIVNHVLDITYIIFQAIKDRSNNKNNSGNEDGTNFISKLKEMLNNLICQNTPTPSPISNTVGRRTNRNDISQEEEW